MGVYSADHLWKTCCALHNMLLNIDSYTEEQDSELGQFNLENVQNIQFILEILTSYAELHNYDKLGIYYREIIENSISNNTSDLILVVTIVKYI